MKLDTATCAEARRTHDARFDGRFFIAVLSSGVYCRPICPSRTAKDANVRYFASAAAAARAGFRPCLRCRPEGAPGVSPWMETSPAVSRALRLISESPLADDGTHAFADRLGIAPGQLRGLFLEHIGASPGEVAQNRRLFFGKRLLDETALSIEQVALVAGFGTPRRLHNAIRKTYKRTPEHIRSLVRQPPVEPESEYRFRLSFRRPFDWSGILAFLAPRAIPGVECVEADGYRRTISRGRSHGWIEAAMEKTESALTIRVFFPEPGGLYEIVERARRMFDLDADPLEAMQHLSGDPLLANVSPGLRVPGGWDGFELAVRAILGQQVTVKGASTLAGRLVSEFGTAVAARGGLTHLFPGPEILAEADIARIGLPIARAETIRGVATAVCDGRISFAGGVDIADFVGRFRALPGIGDWTAQYVAMRALGYPDAFPCGDLGLLHATGFGHARELEARSQAWRPWRAYAAMHFWQTPQRTGAPTLGD